MLKKIIGKKKIIMLMLGIIIGILISVVGVYAATVVASRDVAYTNTTSKLKATNVQEALDELYTRINTKGKIGKEAIWNQSEGTVTLDGINDYMYLGLDNYNFKNSVSLVIRFKFNNDPSLNCYYAGVRTCSILNNFEAGGIGFQYTSDKGLQFILNVNNNTYYNIITSPNYNYGNMHTIVGTFNGSSANSYFDGTKKTIATISGNITTTSSPMILGANPYIGALDGFYSNIEVSDVLIFARVLNDTEIANNYSSEINSSKVSYDKLLLYYNFKDIFYTNYQYY